MSLHGAISGPLLKTAAENLTGKENHLVTLTSTGAVELTDADAEIPFGVVRWGAPQGGQANIVPVNRGEQLKVRVSANVTAGAALELDTVNDGQLRPKNSGTARAVAEYGASAGAIATVRWI